MSSNGSLGVVLSGGGARGAYEVGVLSYIFGDLAKSRPIDIDMVCGTSVGAVNGTFLASTVDDTVAGMVHLEEMWLELELADVLSFGLRQLSGFHRVLLGGGNRPRGIFDARPLARIVGEGVRWKKLQENVQSGRLKALTVSATRVSTGRPVIFTEARADVEVPSELPSRATMVRSRIGPSHVLASAAIPIVFPPVLIGSSLHCDGGLRLNTPTSPAIHLGADKLLVLGVSRPGTPPTGAVRPPGATFLLGKVLNAFLLDHVNADLQELDRINRILSDGVAMFGDDFVDVLNTNAGARGEPALRKIDALAIHPSEDIGRLAADHLETHQVKFGRLLGRTFMKLLDVGGGGDADLASYLMFDGAFARRLIELGRRDARSMKDEIEAFLY